MEALAKLALEASPASSPPPTWLLAGHLRRMSLLEWKVVSLVCLPPMGFFPWTWWARPLFPSPWDPHPPSVQQPCVADFAICGWVSSRLLTSVCRNWCNFPSEEKPKLRIDCIANPSVLQFPVSNLNTPDRSSCGACTRHQRPVPIVSEPSLNVAWQKTSWDKLSQLAWPHAVCDAHSFPVKSELQPVKERQNATTRKHGRIQQPRPLRSKATRHLVGVPPSTRAEPKTFEPSHLKNM